MNREIAAAVALALLATPVAGCQTLQTPPTGASVQLRTTQALYVAEAAFAGASLALETAADSGVLQGPAAAKDRRTYDLAHDALLASRAAKIAGDSAFEPPYASQAALDAKLTSLQALNDTAFARVDAELAAAQAR